MNENQESRADRTILNLFDEESKDIFREVSLVYSDRVETSAAETELLPSLPTSVSVGTEKICQLCDQTFSQREDQVQHFKSSWHLYNLRQKIIGQKPVAEARYKLLEELDSPPTSSDSEDSDEDCPAPKPVHKPYRHTKIFLKNHHNNVVSLYQTIVYGKNNVPQTIQELLYVVTSLTSHFHWAVILMGGGHFAAAIFNKNDVEVHKTFHRYTVRAKQGGGQRAKDNQSGLSQPKSAGANLRRKNELALEKDIQELLLEWAALLKKCDKIFLRAAGHNQAVFYSGRNPAFSKGDPRIRTIPFSTKKPTFFETQRVHRLLASIEVHSDLHSFETSKQIPEQQSSADKDDLPIQPEEQVNIDTLDDQPKGQSAVIRDDASSVHQEESLDSQLPEPGSQVPEPEAHPPTEEISPQEVPLPAEANNVKPGPEKKKKNKKKPKPKVPEVVESELITACRALDWTRVAESVSPSSLSSQDCEGNTALHYAAQHSQGDLVFQLMEAGADPAIKNKKGQVSFALSGDKETRNAFRRFMGQYPDQYDYGLAQIPSPLTEESEKMKREKNSEKNREKKKKQKLKKSEEEQCKIFLALSDKDKAALNQGHIEKRNKDLVRCVLCGKKLNGQSPFEYLQFAFCSMNCLRVHRFS